MRCVPRSIALARADMYMLLRAAPVGSVGSSVGGRSGRRDDGRGRTADSADEVGNVDRIGVGAAADEDEDDSDAREAIGVETAAFLTALEERNQCRGRQRQSAGRVELSQRERETHDEKRVRLESTLAASGLLTVLAAGPPPRTGKSSSSGSGVVGVLLSLGLKSSAPAAGESVSGSNVGGSVWMNCARGRASKGRRGQV